MDTPLYGFSNHPVAVEGIIALPVKISCGVNLPPQVKFPTKQGIGEVKDNQITARQCYMTSCKSKNKEALIIEDLWEDMKMQIGEPVEDLVSIEKSFKELKTYLSFPPLLSKPLSREDLFLYLLVTEVAVSAVLVREEDGIQKPIYYVSKVLEDVETRYPKIDKIALALIISARRLRPYFQSHTIVVLTDQPLRKVLLSPEASGRLNLYVDGSSAVGSSGAEIILITPEGFMAEYALRFGFQASNNEAEYEALLTGIRLAHALKVDSLSVYSGSQLVINHVLGDYEARDERMAQYLQLVKTLASKFKIFAIRQISWDQNTQVDTLSRLTSVKVIDVRHSVYLEFLKDHSISSQTEIGVIDQESCWMDMIIKYFSIGKLPSERHEARNLRVKVAQYALVEGVLYKKSFSLPYLRCLRPSESFYALQEAENMNQCILQGLKKKLDEVKGAWVDELLKVLWVYRTTPHSITGETPFLLCYGTEAMLPIEIGVLTIASLALQ
ncbi:hypothetical protein RJ639_010839 [Escallonia herrerae]|uniref:RNase H type-1 domain-containing protein n=1 Tax=Escallonia herrerae TaxID=1293975 RepID=A0AA89APX8_9ASTE|nr:hypothetical protein RJ639_010839 [Escallonia herrerae]